MPIIQFVNSQKGNWSYCQIIKFSNYIQILDTQYQLGNPSAGADDPAKDRSIASITFM